ncbi:hypothetical protein PR202_ga03051 [Eleusine coracana subsp. coracana]|uniref:BHLH domain-containing protein n=1 Tax=Eleusine coracana subsp. coracana TaxID=191504 RepID=A0AAV5BMK5_ELECO|nr:hypothetical protein PR202_ga03051 [Eleusine coracana subsp. coracana]
MQPSGREMQGGGGQDDFFNQMLSTLPTAWTELGSGKSPWELAATEDPAAFDESALLASRLRHHQIGGDKQPVMLQLSDLHGLAGGEDAGNAGFLPLPLFTDRTREDMDAAFKPPNNAAGGDQQQALYNGFGAAGMHGASAVQPPPFGQLRRERIAERMKALQELVPNANKTDKASMLDEIIDYVKFLQLQVKVLSMSRLGGASAVAPLVANMSSEGNGNGNGSENGCSSLRLTEQQVAKLMEEDMGSAMQYLQGKGLCLMPISLASAISSATSPSLLSRPSVRPVAGAGGPLHDSSSPASPPLVNGACGNDSRTINDAGAGDKQ